MHEEDYHFLSLNIDVVVHAAANVNLLYPIGGNNLFDYCDGCIVWDSVELSVEF